MAHSRGLYSFVFVGFSSDAPLAFSCVGEINANSLGTVKCLLYWKDKKTLSKTENLEKIRPVFLSTFFLYFAVSCNSDSQKENQKELRLSDAILPLKRDNVRIYGKKRKRKAKRETAKINLSQPFVLQA